jgi:hypothetical protein
LHFCCSWHLGSWHPSSVVARRTLPPLAALPPVRPRFSVFGIILLPMLTFCLTVLLLRAAAT